ncbi:MAG: translocation/assembly module TamB domain-containing protein [Methylococcales bacterium]|nr:translocation/assembly module TamB domain-containing protein [Methylococcales bacterium]
MKKRLIVFIVLLVVLAVPLGLWGLVSTESGSQWLLRKVIDVLPAQVSVATIEGRLLDRLVLTDVHYQTDTENLSVKSFVFTWQADALLHGQLKIGDVLIDGVNLALSEPKDPPPPGNFDLNAELPLPVQISVDNFLLTKLVFKKADTEQALEKLHLKANTEDGLLKITALDLTAQPIIANLQGQVALGKGYGFAVTTQWQLDGGKNGLWQGTTKLTGDINKLVFDNQLAAPFKLALNGQLDDLQTSPRISSKADWQNLKWPLVNAPPQIQSKQGRVELTGGLDDFQVLLNSRLSQEYLPEASLSFKGKGSQTSMAIEKLALTSKTGVFQVQGKVSWKDAPDFELTASGQNFNPGIFMPEMAGNLTFSSHLKGKMAASGLQLAADINNLSGKLRGYPVAANGKLVLNGDQLQVDTLRLSSGPNKIAVHGTMGQAQAQLTVDMDTPALETLWPGLGGSLKGEGVLQGAWKNPTVKFRADGKGIRFEGHSVGKLGLDIDYSQDISKTSKIALSASTIKTGELQIASVQLDGVGSLPQHRFTIDVNSEQLDVATAFTGSLKAENWQGDFSKLDLDSKDLGLWQLKKNLLLGIKKVPAGVDVVLGDNCLVQKSASICTQGRYMANGDLGVDLKVADLPTGLLDSYFPKDMRLIGVVDADAHVQSQKGVYSGHYRLGMPPSTFSVQDKVIALGTTALSGTIKGNTVLADLDLALAGQDFVRARLQLDTGKSQALSGQVSASMREFSVVELFVPQLSGVKGQLNADVNLSGTLPKPLVMGNIDLTQGAFDVEGQGAGLSDINLHVVATAGRANRIQVNGSLLPALLKPVGAIGQVQLKGLVNINADIQQQNSLLSGDYKIESPPVTIQLLAENTTTKLQLGAGVLSGTLDGDLVSAELDLKLLAQDYLRARLQLNTGKAQTLSGDLNASVLELAALNAFVPQLSQIKGQLSADLSLQGTLQEPQASGAIRFTGGAFNVDALGIGLRDIKLQALGSGDGNQRIQVTGSVKSGEGAVKLEGFISLQADEGRPIELTLKGDNFEVAKLPEAQIAITPDLVFAMANNKAKITGLVKVPKAIFVLKELPESAVKVSADEIILGEEKPEVQVSTPVAVDADIDIALGKQVSFTGQGLTTHLDGRLKIIKSGEKMAMHGTVDMVKARYKSYGQDLTVRKGRFQFDGPVDNPWLDVEAIRLSKSKKVTAVLSLSGPLKKPQTRISSEPALPESEALAYLVTGNPLNQVSKSEGNMLAAAALSYGGGKASWLTEKLGIDEFEVQEGETLEDTLVTVGEYLTPDFYVGAKVGLFNKQAAMVLKHKLTNNINVETQAGTSQRVKINYEIDTD